jgi:protein-tyrosine phosphatase
MQQLVDDQNLTDEVFVDSAGTIGFHDGKPADSRMIKAASRRGYNLTSRSRKIIADDLENFDLVIAMDRENYSDIHLVCESPTAQVALLSDFLDENWPKDVPDPYYGGESGFETVLDMIEAACPSILQRLQSN